MSISTWINDLRWAATMLQARTYRRRLSFSRCRKFDAALQPRIEGGHIAYPDAIYQITIYDLRWAIKTSQQA